MLIDPRFMYWGTTKGAADVAVPFPAVGGGLFTTSRNVDAGRNANGVVVGQMVGRSIDKQNMSWKVLPPEKWWEMNRFVEDNGMFFWCHYFSHGLGKWMDRKFYCGDFTANPYMVDANTGSPKWYLDCSVNVIDTGEGD